MTNLNEDKPSAAANESMDWNSAIKWMLQSIETLSAAKRFAVYERDCGGPSPTIVIPSGERHGGVVFEWHEAHGTTIVEFVSGDRAKYTRFSDGRVVVKRTMIPTFKGELV